MRVLITTFLLMIFQMSFISQNSILKKIDLSNCRDGESVEYCKTHKLMNKLKEDPEFVKEYNASQIVLKKIENQIANGNQNRVIYTIPLVFHVLHNGGPENISRAQIEDAVAILNRDYRLQNADANNVQSVFAGMPADIEIEFQLATKAPNGQCFSGITRTQSPLTNSGANGQNQVSAIIAGNDVFNGSWPGNKYLNIMVVNDADGAAGYTTNPNNWSGTSMNNGIWVLHDYVGSIGTSDTYSSRTLTHEVGHWLNLDHLWGNNNNPGNASSCSQDDAVDDTPRCIGVTSCNLNSNTCSNDAADGYWTSDVIDNVENYMEYSYCNKMFTNGQKNRMRAALLSSVGGRNNIWTSSNQIATGLNSTPSLCAVGIRVERDIVCGGDDVQFFDESYNNIVSWDWSFPNGTPSSSTNQNPMVSYSGSGDFDVTLEVTDALGNTMTQTFPNFISVIGNPGYPPPIYEGFENIASLPSNDWTIYNPEGPGFDVVATGSASGAKSVKLDNSQGQTGSVDELISNTIDLSNSAAASISFKYAFAKRNSGNSDYLQIFASKDCGESWFMRKNISTSILGTMANTNSNFTPSGSDWKTIVISPSSFSNYLVSDFRFKFKFVNGGGNDLYIDDINLSGSLSIEETEKVYDFKVYPNPVVENLLVSFNSLINLSNPLIEIYDATGRIIKSINLQNISKGENNLEVSSIDLDSGWYILKIISDEKSISTKFLKQ
ncbi:MAG: M43 family zinc metalloprotease [Flavobacteriales bacterium]|nr:M43 family zinc metalloprotease [Flavobacteriales bacterium]MDG1798801.1 M43 family zinc metalloprotease [Flavobacteriales bacterium]